QPAPLAPTVALAGNPASVTSGGSSTLIWSSTDATSCVASGAWSGPEATSGTQPIGPLAADGRYSLTCTGLGGSASASTTVTVSSATSPPPVPTVTLTAAPTSIASGGS